MKTITVQEKVSTRLNKYISEQGVVSRRHADEMITSGHILVNGKKAILGQKVIHGDVISLVQVSKEHVYALYNKPRGEVTGKLPSLPGCDPVGRLDKESEGLLLYTNDYRVVDALLHPRHAREKEYEVSVREKMTPRVITLLRRGIRTQETTYAPVKSVSIYNEGRSLRIIITEGKKHEIRRMLNALNLTVLSLKRVRIMSFSYRGIAPGKVHTLTERQQETLFKDLGLEISAPISS